MTQPAITTVGLIGAGRMGMPIVGHLVRKGFRVIVNDADAGKRPGAEQRGAVWATEPAAMADAGAGFSNLGHLIFQIAGWGERDRPPCEVFRVCAVADLPPSPYWRRWEALSRPAEVVPLGPSRRQANHPDKPFQRIATASSREAIPSLNGERYVSEPSQPVGCLRHDSVGPKYHGVDRVPAQ